jgi:hypothetical protein
MSNPCFGCASPASDPAPTSGWGTWITRYGGGWMFQPSPAPFNPNPVVVNTPASSPSKDGTALCNPVVFSSQAQSATPPAPSSTAGPLAVTGAAGSSADPNSDGNRKATGKVPGTSVVFGS